MQKSGVKSTTSDKKVGYEMRVGRRAQSATPNHDERVDFSDGDTPPYCEEVTWKPSSFLGEY